MSEGGGIEYHVRAILEATKANKARQEMVRWGASVSAAGASITGAGQAIAGQTLQIAGAFAKIAAGATAAAGALGMGALVVAGVMFNAELENTQYAIASTLQLFNHSATVMRGGMEQALAPAEQFVENLKVGEQSMDKLFRIGAASPATFKETTTMFQNMLPGARSVTDNMETILDLTKKSLALGMIMGGDFATTGAQMSRMLTGGAGAEFETWKVLQTPILEAGKAAGIFNEKMEAGAKLTEKFNQLGKEQRLYLVQQAVEKLGVVTEAYGLTWAGVTSTVESNLQMIMRNVGKATFSKLKDRMKDAVQGGGAFDPFGDTQRKLEQAGTFFGDHVGAVADKFAAKVINGLIYTANNWDTIADKLLVAFDKAVFVGGLLLKFTAARAVMGGAMQVGGGALSAAGGAWETIEKIAGAIGSVGVAGAFALPIAVVLGAAIAGVGVALAGVSAWFVSHWKDIVTGFENGTITLGPLLDTFDNLWAKLVAVGEVMMGTNDAGVAVQAMLLGVTEGMYWVGGAFSLFLRVAGVVEEAVSAIVIVFELLYTTITATIAGLLKLFTDLAPALPGGYELAGVADMRALSEALFETADSSAKDAGERMSKFGNNDFFKAADAFDTAVAKSGEGITAGLRKHLGNQKYAGRHDEAHVLQNSGGRMGGSDKLVKSGNTTHIHKLVINQDLRNHDPDRVVGAFYRAVDKVATKKTQASTLPSGGR